ncbi:hypothetical protein [Nonomuraea sp. NPDC049709]|uniref:hypothetical protein n=1 Tax=Nonomuraea sp. NPDC049709 TaxID=3154736 RepID=UPI00344086CE
MVEGLIALALVIMGVLAVVRFLGVGRSPDRWMIVLGLIAGFISMLFEALLVGPDLTALTGSRSLPFAIQTGTAVHAMAWILAWTLYAWRQQGKAAWWARPHTPLAAATLVAVVLGGLAFSYDLDYLGTYAAVGHGRVRAGLSWPSWPCTRAP